MWLLESDGDVFHGKFLAPPYPRLPTQFLMLITPQAKSSGCVQGKNSSLAGLLQKVYELD